MPTFVDTLTSTRKLNHSVNGNPRYLLAFTDHGILATKSDASCSYDVDNLARRIGTGQRIVVRTTPADRVWGLEPVDEGATYDVFYVENKRKQTTRQVGILTGASLLHAIERSTDPDRILFRKAQS